MSPRAGSPRVTSSILKTRETSLLKTSVSGMGMGTFTYSVIDGSRNMGLYSGSGWESNPPRPATRPATGFEDQEARRDLTTPADKHTRWDMDSQAGFRFEVIWRPVR